LLKIDKNTEPNYNPIVYIKESNLQFNQTYNMKTQSILSYKAYLRGIYREAINLSNQGWIVLANEISGFNPPPEIEGVVPDIYAVKNSQTQIILIETKEEYKSLKHKTLKEYSQKNNKIQFNIWLVNNDGCRLKEIV
jgi:hypothetical protein